MSLSKLNLITVSRKDFGVNAIFALNKTIYINYSLIIPIMELNAQKVYS